MTATMDEDLLGLWCDALGIDRAAGGPGSPDPATDPRSFFELGGYSLLALALADRIAATVGVDVPRTVVFEHPTFPALHAYVTAAGPASAADRLRSPGQPAEGQLAGAERAGATVEPFPLSELQQAYLLGETGEFELGGPALLFEEYSCPPLDVESFRHAVDALVQRHPMLRARFDVTAQRVATTVPVAPVEVRSLRNLDRDECDRLLADSARQLRASPPPLDGGLTFQFRVFELADRYHVQFCGRLLVFDGLSGQIFAEDLATLLRAEALPPLSYTYREYRVAAERSRREASYAEAHAYWAARLPSLPPAPTLPSARRPSAVPATLQRRTHTLSASRWASFTAAARQHGLTPTAAVCAAFVEVLRHWSAGPAFAISMMYGDRQPRHPDVNRVIGNFSTTLLLECAAGDTGGHFVNRARTLHRQLSRDLAHGEYGGVEVIRQLNRQRRNLSSATMPVVFASLLGVRGAGGGGSLDGRVFLERLGWTRRTGTIHTPQVSFDHQVFETQGALALNWDTADSWYPPGLLDDMFVAYRGLLERLATEPDAWTERRFALTPRAQLDVRRQINDTAVAVRPQTLHGGFIDHVRQAPDRPAVITSETTITYAELHHHARVLAHTLRRAGCQPGDLVAVIAGRGWRQIATLLGVLYAGGAYVPLAPDWPAARREKIISTAGIPWVLTEATIDAALNDNPPADALLDVPVPVDSEALAYVIFTSGSTGSPKGVMIRHQSAMNTIADINQRFGVTADDRVLAVSEYTFDLSVYDVFGLLTAGGVVVVPDSDQAREVVHLEELARSAGVTVWNSVPAYLGLLIDYLRGGERPALDALRLALVSGDWVPVRIAHELATVAPLAGCVSLGGATEAAIWSNYLPVPVEPPDWASVPYGYPLANQEYRVLDEAYLDRPDWVAGELYIAGRGLADGYLNNESETERAFRIHPHTGQRIYRTGDWGRYWPDGTLEFLGRRDDQVKVNGFRVELGEIESCLVRHPAVSSAATIVHRDALAAFVVPEGVVPEGAEVAAPPDGQVATLRGDAAGFPRSDLIAHLRDQLPPYLVPQTIRVLAALPLTANGKVDRARLARLATTGGDADRPRHRRPGSATERVVASLWSEVLGVDEPGATEDFFAAGGNSISGSQLTNRIDTALGVRLPLAVFYEHSTVESIARLIDSRQFVASDHFVTLADNGRPPLFLIHPVGGDVLCYRPLVAELRHTFRVLGIRAIPPTGPDAPTSLEELARAYLGRVTKLVQDGPVRLAGWSLGGVLAYEMGRQLAAAGRRDAVVVLLDPWVAPPGSNPAAVTDAALLRSFFFNMTHGRVDLSPPADADLARTLALVQAEHPPLAALSPEEIGALYRTFEINSRALLRYTVPVVDGVGVCVVETDDGLRGAGGSYLTPLRNALSLPGAHRERVEGDHFTIVGDAAAGPLAALIARRAAAMPSRGQQAGPTR